MPPKIVVANWVHPEVLAYLRQHGEVVANETREPWPRAELLGHCRDAAALIAFMPESVDDDFLAECPDLRIVACALKGYDNFDVQACNRHGVWLTFVPDLLTVPTAELTVGLTIGLTRQVRAADLIVVTKVDLAPDGGAGARAWCAEVAPGEFLVDAAPSGPDGWVRSLLGSPPTGPSVDAAEAAAADSAVAADAAAAAAVADAHRRLLQLRRQQDAVEQDPNLLSDEQTALLDTTKGLLVQAQLDLRAAGRATQPGVYADAMKKRVEDSRTRLEEIQQRTGNPELSAIINEMLDASAQVSLEPDNGPASERAAESVKKAAQRFGAGYDGSKMADLDPLLPKAYKGSVFKGN